MILNVHNEHFSCYYEIVDASTLIEAVKMLNYVECYFVLNNNGHLFSSRTAKCGHDFVSTVARATTLR